MIWRRSIDSNPITMYLPLLSVFIIIMSFYGKSSVLFWIGILSGLSTVLSSRYIDFITRRLSYNNNRQTIRMFPGDQDQWKVQIANRSRLPVFSGNLTFLLDNQCSIKNLQPIEERRNVNEYSVPFTFLPNEPKSLTFNITGNRRGVAKVSMLSLTVYDLMNATTGKLVNDRLVQSELIVYPTLLPVGGVQQLIQSRQGSRVVPSSLFEDRNLVVGTKDYEAGDSFQRIHWKASARMEELQTKIYEKAMTQTWTIFLNVIFDPKEAARLGESELLEKQISYTAYLCQFAFQQNIPFEIYINIKTRGRIPYMHLEKGEGKSQLAKALELLARLNNSSIKVPMHRVLSMFERRHFSSSVLILVGDDQTDADYYERFNRQGMDLYKVFLDESSASLDRLEKRRAIS
ncbi:DUF58 domain-containing protein [Alkalihalobacillus sp. AL-G]|uniref:DUF58 domain-containing protein n=1 Tax=Alkalihalobacillus sp. AL-G TaxID=2926399 RepID=UPI00272A43EA|nr:DUF58 domain-containing protein [Alkalihalobacillus sp. AL-G]WLD91950.1 DUF58 domain-containing protein [Alkalihalobacillus sp. AL-G]